MNPKDFSKQQIDVILLLSPTAGLTTKEINSKVHAKTTLVLLDSLRNRGVAKASGHYAPGRCKWVLTDAGAQLQRELLLLQSASDEAVVKNK